LLSPGGQLSGADTSYVQKISHKFPFLTPVKPLTRHLTLFQEVFEPGMVLRAVAQLAALRRKSMTGQFTTAESKKTEIGRVRRGTADSNGSAQQEDEELVMFHYTKSRVINPK
jgi:hypothetical protein